MDVPFPELVDLVVNEEATARASHASGPNRRIGYSLCARALAARRYVSWFLR
ncbi:hypothetical protein QFZ49_000107 [Streptomyces turgidiscabies]|uniref:Transposase n=1 Tax=Streptomyces turgidiscabies TaxID=85558 RepID=A0ABU0RDY6_9ACTN|nr:hypothetical protein [Streptomyces turgidiscabies]